MLKAEKRHARACIEFINPDPAPQSLRRHAHKESLDTPGLPASSAELSVLKETRVAAVLKVRHINYIEVRSCRSRELNGEPFQSPGLPPRTDELALVHEGHVTDALQVGHVSHTQARDLRIELQLETFQWPGLPSSSSELVIMGSSVSDALKMHEHVKPEICRVV